MSNGLALEVQFLASLLADHRSDKASLDRASLLAASLQDSRIPQFKDTMGWVYYRRGDFRTAVTLLEPAAANLPGLALAHYHLGMCYSSLGQFEKAADQFKAALAADPDTELEMKIKNGMKTIAARYR